MTGTQTSTGVSQAQKIRAARAFSLELIKDERVRYFTEHQPHIDDLRRNFRYPAILPLIRGRFKFEGLNRYPDPEKDPNTRCASWTMFGSADQNYLDKRKHHTYGIFAQGRHEFNLGEYSERMNVLQGELQIEVEKEGEEEIFLVKPGERQLVPAFCKVVFETAVEPVRYICEYDKAGFQDN